MTLIDVVVATESNSACNCRDKIGETFCAIVFGFLDGGENAVNNPDLDPCPFSFNLHSYQPTFLYKYIIKSSCIICCFQT